MKLLPLALLLMATCLVVCPASAEDSGVLLFDFRAGTSIESWVVEDDGVMGGLSRGNFAPDPQGFAVFSGRVSLENNGGFSSVQKFMEPIDVSGHHAAVLRLRGDGKTYRFIVEADRDARHYYEVEFPTSGDWQDVVIPLANLYPVRRGDRLERPNFNRRTIAQVRFMIANGRAEDFRLEIATIRLK